MARRPPTAAGNTAVVVIGRKKLTERRARQQQTIVPDPFTRPTPPLLLGAAEMAVGVFRDSRCRKNPSGIKRAPSGQLSGGECVSRGSPRMSTLLNGWVIKIRDERVRNQRCRAQRIAICDTYPRSSKCSPRMFPSHRAKKYSGVFRDGRFNSRSDVLLCRSVGR